MYRLIKYQLLLLLVSIIFIPENAKSEVRPAKIFQSDMVLQQQMPIRIWGTADPNEKVEVWLGKEKKEVSANAQGKWTVVFSARKASFTPIELKINTQVFTNILIGELWLCAGQSNMAFPVGKSDIPEKTGLTENPSFRYLKMIPPRGVAKEGYNEEELSRCNARDFFQGRWVSCTAKSIPLNSAVGWLFGQNLSENLQVPVGVIEIAVGGSAMNNWIPSDVLKNYAPTAGLFNTDWLNNPEVFPPHRKRAAEALQTVLKKDEPFIPGKMPYRWMCEPGFLFEAGIEQLNSFSMRGIVWYQGESDAYNQNAALQFYPMLSLLIDNWRISLNRDKMPFVIVQLPAFGVNAWPSAREAQREIAASKQNISLVTTLDLGEKDNIHPTDKDAIGKRVARMVLKDVYKKKIQGFPEVKKIVQEKDKLVISFYNCNDGWRSTKGIIRGFEVAGKDSVFSPVPASLGENNTIQVNINQQAVNFLRYAWEAFPTPALQLFNQDGLPLGPFFITIENKIR